MPLSHSSPWVAGTGGRDPESVLDAEPILTVELNPKDSANASSDVTVVMQGREGERVVSAESESASVADALSITRSMVETTLSGLGQDSKRRRLVAEQLEGRTTSELAAQLAWDILRQILTPEDLAGKKDIAILMAKVRERYNAVFIGVFNTRLQQVRNRRSNMNGALAHMSLVRSHAQEHGE